MYKTTLRTDDATGRRLKAIARVHRRTINNMLEVLVDKEWKRRKEAGEVVDLDEPEQAAK